MDKIKELYKLALRIEQGMKWYNKATEDERNKYYPKLNELIDKYELELKTIEDLEYRDIMSRVFRTCIINKGD